MIIAAPFSLNRHAASGGSAGNVTLVQSAVADGSNVSFSSAATAGNLIVVFVGREETTISQITCTSYDNLALAPAVGASRFGYKLSAAGGEQTFGFSGGDYYVICAMEFSYDGTASYDTQNGAANVVGNASVATGNITTAATALAVFGLHIPWWPVSTVSNPQINGAAPDGATSASPGGYVRAYYTETASSFTGGGTATLSSSETSYNAVIISFSFEVE